MVGFDVKHRKLESLKWGSSTEKSAISALIGMGRLVTNAGSSFWWEVKWNEGQQKHGYSPLEGVVFLLTLDSVYPGAVTADSLTDTKSVPRLPSLTKDQEILIVWWRMLRRLSFLDMPTTGMSGTSAAPVWDYSNYQGTSFKDWETTGSQIGDSGWYYFNVLI